MTGGLDLWIRSEWRRRWRGLLGVALLIALGGGITIAAIAGARRADSATDRFLEQAGSRITVTASPEFAIGTELGMWDTIPAQIAAVPGVRGVLPVSWEGIALQSGGEPGFFFMGLNGTGVGDDPPTGLTVIEGRLAADAADDEIALNEEAVRFTGASVGDTIELRSYSRDQMAEFGSGNGAEDLGPRVEAEVVGIVRGPEDLADNPEPQAFLSTGFRTTYNDQIAACDCAVFVNAATEDVDEVTARLTALLADQPVTVERSGRRHSGPRRAGGGVGGRGALDCRGDRGARCRVDRNAGHRPLPRLERRIGGGSPRRWVPHVPTSCGRGR